MDETCIDIVRREDIPYIEERLKKYLLDTTGIDWQQFFVARLKNRPVAFGRIIDLGEYFEIASLGVDYYQRKKGIGAKMLQFLLAEAKKRNADKDVYIVTHIPGFFKRYGFEEVTECPAYLNQKREGKCHLDKSMITIMKVKD